MESNQDENSAVESTRTGQYIVVARRYRPQDFGDLVGQDMVSKALCNALETDRVGHAYLFTGARGVGKTSSARIFAKMLNCVRGPTTKPCNECDICQGIAAGEDVDVLEIDGASNRGIDEIRQLRSNVGVRPSRGRCKVYIIDEVHMLTKEAFNALLKTLEEPPEHVKFIFCTTAPEKIPITVLSRCQRFDFSPVQQAQIVQRLQEIVTAEGATAETEALEILARRAAGSMRDSQSLLEQLLAFSGREITVDSVHGMLGTAKNSRITSLLENLLSRDAAAALGDIEGAISEGVDPGQLAEQLIGCIRDLLALAVGSKAEALRFNSPGDAETLRQQANAWGIETLLAVAQIVDQALVRMRQSMHSRIILETAVIRIARLDQLQSLADLAAQLESGVASSLEPAITTKKKDQPSPPSPVAPPAHDATIKPHSAAATISSNLPTNQQSPANSQSAVAEPPIAEPPVAEPAVAKPAVVEPPASSTAEAPSNEANQASGPSVDSAKQAADAQQSTDITDENVRHIWATALQGMGDMTADAAAHCKLVKCDGPSRLVLFFTETYNSSRTFCERADRRKTLEEAVADVVGKRVQIEFRTIRADSPDSPAPQLALSRGQVQRMVLTNPFVKSAMEMFDAEVAKIDSDQKRL